MSRYLKLWNHGESTSFPKFWFLLDSLNLFTCNKCCECFLWRYRLTLFIFEKMSARYRYIYLNNHSLSACYSFKKKWCSMKKIASATQAVTLVLLLVPLFLWVSSRSVLYSYSSFITQILKITCSHGWRFNKNQSYLLFHQGHPQLEPAFLKIVMCGDEEYSDYSTERCHCLDSS